MKFATIACALIAVTEASKSHKDEENQDESLSQLISSALAGAPPGVINQPPAVQGVDKEGQTKTTEGHTKNYKFLWQYVCAFTKWTPTNQWLHAQETDAANLTFDPATMTLERFGFIGEDKKCYWGMTGVEWVTPLKVNQIPGFKPKNI